MEGFYVIVLWFKTKQVMKNNQISKYLGRLISIFDIACFQRHLHIHILKLSSNCTPNLFLVFPDQKNSVWRFSNYELEKGLSKWTGELKCFVAWQLTIPTAALLLLPVNLHVGICWVGRCYQNWRLLLLQNDQIFIIYFPKKHWRQASKWHLISSVCGGAIFGWFDSWKKCSQEHKLAILHQLNPGLQNGFRWS